MLEKTAAEHDACMALFPNGGIDALKFTGSFNTLTHASDAEAQPKVFFFFWGGGFMG